jgi:hypothetical protein
MESSILQITNERSPKAEQKRSSSQTKWCPSRTKLIESIRIDSETDNKSGAILKNKVSQNSLCNSSKKSSKSDWTTFPKSVPQLRSNELMRQL